MVMVARRSSRDRFMNRLESTVALTMQCVMTGALSVSCDDITAMPSRRWTSMLAAVSCYGARTGDVVVHPERFPHEDEILEISIELHSHVPGFVCSGQRHPHAGMGRAGKDAGKILTSPGVLGALAVFSPGAVPRQDPGPASVGHVSFALRRERPDLDS
ncbi:hypothetical protein [Sorangium sp. So ce887]|uniref:hypothetical protein n=1 Tax=Sorangium sp. So ce887 TaxID=3133324 RepID=UPI003F60B5D2